MKTIYLECNMGASGDMLMSALYEICEQKEWFLYKMNEVFSPFGISFEAKPAIKCGVRGTHIQVLVHGEEETGSPDVLQEHIKDGGHSHIHTDDIHDLAQEDEDTHEHTHEDEEEHHHAHTDYFSILAQIDSLPLAEDIREDATAIYRLLGEAESKVHGTTIDQIHFHEIGTLDALADVVGCSLLIHLIAPEQILASPIHVGNGFIRCAHGVLPVPAPATAELLQGVPFYTGSITAELCTPTGAAILKYYVSQFFAMPTLSTTAIGYGMGNKDFEIANCIRAFLGETPNDYREEDDDSFSSDDTIISLSCNIDDMTGEALGLATEILMAAGALDVYTIPIQMKKNRPGILLTCLCRPEDREKFTGLFFLHTSTRGIRFQTYERSKLESTFETRSTRYGDIRIKKSTGYGIKKEKAEFEDLKSVVLKNGCSLEDVTNSLHLYEPRKKK